MKSNSQNVSQPSSTIVYSPYLGLLYFFFRQIVLVAVCKNCQKVLNLANINLIQVLFLIKKGSEFIYHLISAWSFSYNQHFLLLLDFNLKSFTNHPRKKNFRLCPIFETKIIIEIFEFLTRNLIIFKLSNFAMILEKYQNSVSFFGSFVLFDLIFIN